MVDSAALCCLEEQKCDLMLSRCYKEENGEKGNKSRMEYWLNKPRLVNCVPSGPSLASELSFNVMISVNKSSLYKEKKDIINGHIFYTSD